MTASDEASGTPRTDAVIAGGTVGQIAMRQHAEQLERELAAMELRAMDCVALNERQAINFAKCQSELQQARGELQRSFVREESTRKKLRDGEQRKDVQGYARRPSAQAAWDLLRSQLQQARTMHAEAIEEWAKWEGAAKQARGEAHTFNFSQNALDAASREVHMMLLREDSNWGTKACEEMGRTFMVAYHRALKPSPASGEQINAAGQASGQPHFARGQENKPAPAAPSTAPQVAETGSRSQDVQGPAAAVPDDPMMVLLSLTPKSDTGILRFPEWHDAIRALAAHYEAKGMRMAAEICKSVSAAESERTIGRPTSGEYQIGAEFCAAAILAAATKQEADRGRR